MIRLVMVTDDEESQDFGEIISPEIGRIMKCHKMLVKRTHPPMELTELQLLRSSGRMIISNAEANSSVSGHRWCSIVGKPECELKLLEMIV
jgi:hypothetical protein